MTLSCKGIENQSLWQRLNSLKIKQKDIQLARGGGPERKQKY